MGSVKRLIDIAVSATGLVLLSPVLAGIALVSLILLGRPVLFRQERPGLRGRPFRLVKFRTMRADRSGEVERTPDAERLTRWGRFLRRQSLDELPELWNVLRGEMSLVGPRPLLVEYLPLYSARQARRHEVLPGMTGWAQVNGRNALSWEEKFELDVWYVDHRTLGLDLAILLATLTTVARRRGISAAGEATMRRFEGSETEAKEREGAT
ncbi:MAG TPA: sugar transferase [Thermoanaerobaculia bacterium]|jgi:lipopolysaccharide/colanic/teichoic acid biosynthesis glycosyltransferase|nr:sugar transferase [Thermoanaerobaculia bacterium]